MRIFKHKRFSQWARKEKITDKALIKAVNELINGLYEANLGSGLYKKRVARRGQGKRGAYRTLIAFKQNDRCFFVFGFAKNERDNIGITEKVIFQKLANDYLQATNDEIKRLMKIGEIIEVI